MADRITITVKNWHKHNPRKDIKHPSWFAMSNRILEDPDFFDFTDSEWRAVLYIFSQASQKNSPTVTLVVSHADQVCRVKPATLTRTLDKLAAIGCVQVALDPRTESERDRQDKTNTTEQDKQDKTDTNVNVGSVPDTDECESLSPAGLLEIWNQGCGTLAKARELNDKRETAARARIKEKPDPEYWRDVVKKISESDWCNNRAQNSKGWEATFDWLLQPDTHLRVLEDKYKSRKGRGSTGPPPGANQRDLNADQEIQEIMNEVLGDVAG